MAAVVILAAEALRPSAAEIKKARLAAGLSQSAAAAIIHSTLRTWQDWEAGVARMHGGLWELFCIKTGTPGPRADGA